MKLLENKVVIVTGAARGIGEGIALKLAAQGAHIALTYVSEGSADKTAAVCGAAVWPTPREKRRDLDRQSGAVEGQKAFR